MPFFFPVIAFIVSPLSLTVNIFNRPYTSWRIYLLICSIVPVLGLVTASTLPQSPKYLMKIGKPDEALKLLRRMYAVNKNKPAHTFPVRLSWIARRTRTFTTDVTGAYRRGEKGEKNSRRLMNSFPLFCFSDKSVTGVGERVALAARLVRQELGEATSHLLQR